MKMLCAVFVLCLAGCAATPAFLQGVDAQWQAIGPKYRAYVEGDATLSQREKDIRLLNASTLDLLIEEEASRWE